MKNVLAWSLLTTTISASVHPMPILPDRYHVYVEANINTKNYSLVQEEYYDATDERVKSITWFPGRVPWKGEEHVIDLGSVKVKIYWRTNDDGTVTTCVAGPNFDSFLLDLTGHLRSSNEFLGSDPDQDEYIGRDSSRGIITDVWSRKFVETSSAGEFSYELTSEFAVEPWHTAGSPIRSTLIGKSEFPWGNSRPFKHVYDFIDFTVLYESLDAHFALPLPISFDTDDLDGKCNATGLLQDSTMGAAVLRLPGARSTEMNASSKKRNSDSRLLTVSLIAAFCGLILGFLTHMLIALLWSSSHSSRRGASSGQDSSSVLFSQGNKRANDGFENDGISLTASSVSARANPSDATML